MLVDIDINKTSKKLEFLGNLIVELDDLYYELSTVDEDKEKECIQSKIKIRETLVNTLLI